MLVCVKVEELMFVSHVKQQDGSIRLVLHGGLQEEGSIFNSVKTKLESVHDVQSYNNKMP